MKPAALSASIFRWLCDRLKGLGIEALGLASVFLITRGIWLIYEPAALIFLGIVCGIPYLTRTMLLIKRAEKGEE
jgi:hypothetical protein